MAKLTTQAGCSLLAEDNNNPSKDVFDDDESLQLIFSSDSQNV